jgi:hypothetical protein
VVLAGCVGVGKTALLNHLTGTSFPTGLGGVTQAVHTSAHQGITWRDTPGCSGTLDAHQRVGPALHDADLLIWVIDGLRPLGSGAREALAALATHDVPIRALFSRADILGREEQTEITHRATHLLAEHTQVSPPWVSTRAPLEPDALLETLEAPPLHQVPRRARQLRELLSGGRLHLGPAPADLVRGPQAVLASWRHAVRDAQSTLDQITPTSQEQAVRDAVRDATARFRDALRDDPLTAPLVAAWGEPALPPPPAPPPSTWRQVISGRAGARRAAQQTLTRWLADGELSLWSWMGDGKQLATDDATRVYREAEACLDAVEALLTP